MRTVGLTSWRQLNYKDQGQNGFPFKVTCGVIVPIADNGFKHWSQGYQLTMGVLNDSANQV